MAKKKRNPPKRILKRPHPQRPNPESMPELPDRRAMESVMRQLLGEVTGPREDTPLSRAQEILDEAFQTRSPQKRSELARKALEVSPDCADAYVLLAEQAPGHKAAVELYEQAVAAGERALGPEMFQNEAGHFWALLETRPYMRAREGLAHTLWMMGRRDEAIAHLQDMLRLNPNDNQGLRYTLASWLLNEDRNDELTRLLGAYNEESANWAYTSALLAYRGHGDTPETRRQLKAARRANPHVPDYLVGEAQIPLDRPGYYSPGDENEAVLYVAGALSGWKSTPGAIAWLRETAGKSKKPPTPEPKAQGPLPSIKNHLRHLPQRFDVWQVDSRMMPNWVNVGGENKRLWVTLVTSRSDDLVLAHPITEEPPSSDQLWDELARAMQHPAAGEPHRPTELQVRSGPLWDELRPHLDALDITIEPTDVLDQWDFVFDDLSKHLTGDAPPGLLDMPGVTSEQAAGFYQAAAGFYRRAPWRKLGYETAIRVECEKFESGPWFAVVMGQSGMTFGIALYDDLKVLQQLWANAMSDEENARDTVALAMTFGNEMELPVADLDAIAEHGFEVAGPDAYPWIYRKERGMSMRPPLAWELELAEGCLRAIPAFAARHAADDPSKHTMTVPVASGELKLTLSWAGD